MKIKDLPLNMPCSDPENCKHFKAEMKLREQIKELEAELNWWHELINKHHKNRTCPDLKTYVENLQKRIKELLEIVNEYYAHCGNNKKICGLNYKAEQALKG